MFCNKVSTRNTKNTINKVKYTRNIDWLLIYLGEEEEPQITKSCGLEKFEYNIQKCSLQQTIIIQRKLLLMERATRCSGTTSNTPPLMLVMCFS